MISNRATTFGNAGTRSSEVFSLVDLLATCMGASGGEAGFPTDGVDQIAMLTGEGPSARAVAFIENGYTRAVTDGEFKYVALRFPDEVIRAMAEGGAKEARDHFDFDNPTQTRIARSCFPGYSDADQLYDLGDDPHEQTNITGSPSHQARDSESSLFKFLLSPQSLQRISLF